MARKRSSNHGGYRTPSKPAAVSGPGALSARTDGAPQPAAAYPSTRYGEGVELANQQAAAPLSGGGSGGADSPLSRPSQAAVNVFGATDRPNESPLLGIPANPQPQPEDELDMMVRAMYSIFPTAHLRSLIRRN